MQTLHSPESRATRPEQAPTRGAWLSSGKRHEWQIGTSKTSRFLLNAGLALAIVLVIIATALPNLLRSRSAADQAARARYAAQAGADEQQPAAPAIEPRRVIETASMQMVAAEPAKAAEQIAALAERAGGFVESSQVFHGENQTSRAEVTVRLPAASFEQARAEIRKLAKRVEHENSRSSDVTAQAVDLQATLRNYRAEEAQYLAILHRSASIKDTLEVAQRLGEVRGRIERMQAQLNLLSRQVEMASIAVSLRSEAAAVGPVAWSPMASLRSAWHDAAQGFADYAEAMLVVLFRIPLVLAWGLSVCGLAALGWRVLRWIWKHWFAPVMPQAAS